MLSLCGQDVHLKPIGIRWKMVKYLLGSPWFDIYMVWGSIAQHASSLILLRLATCEGLLNWWPHVYGIQLASCLQNSRSMGNKWKWLFSYQNQSLHFNSSLVYKITTTQPVNFIIYASLPEKATTALVLMVTIIIIESRYFNRVLKDLVTHVYTCSFRFIFESLWSICIHFNISEIMNINEVVDLRFMLLKGGTTKGSSFSYSLCVHACVFTYFCVCGYLSVCK